MNTADFEALENATMALPESERAKLASALVASLDGPGDDEVAEAWDIAICRRINEIESGTVRLLDVDDILASVRARLGG